MLGVRQTAPSSLSFAVLSFGRKIQGVRSNVLDATEYISPDVYMIAFKFEAMRQ
jgi:hypothetical protein